MSALNELIEQIENPELRKRIADEVNKLAKQKKFGLVFEEHQPECTLLYDVPVRKGAKVTLRDAKNITDIYTVLKLENGKALCLKEGAGEAVEFTADSLVTVAGFGEPIYPCLKPVDSICNAPDSDLWHTLYRGRQLSCASAPRISICRQGGLHLYRSSVQHGCA